MDTTLHKPSVIKCWIAESGMKRGEIADLAGISRWTLYRMEQGKMCPLHTIAAVATALRKPAAEALTDEALKKFAALCSAA